MKELISHLLKQVAAILEYVIAFMLAIGMFTSVYSESEHLSELR